VSKSKYTTKSKRQQQKLPTESSDPVDQSTISKLKELIQQRKSIWKKIIDRETANDTNDTKK